MDTTKEPIDQHDNPLSTFNKETLMDFLFNPSACELTFGKNQHTYLLLKASFDQQVDFLYLFDRYHSAHALEIERQPEYVGFVSYQTSHFYDVGYSLRLLLDIKRDEGDSKDGLTKRFCEAVREAIRNQVNGKMVRVTSEADTIYNEEKDRQYFKEHGAAQEALRWFFARQIGTLNFTPDQSSVTTEQIIRFVNEGVVFAASQATAYIAKHARKINLRLWELDQVKAAYLEFERTPGERHFGRAIVESLSDEKKVTLHLLKDGQSFVGKINSDALRNTYGSYISSYHLEAPDRRDFENTFGRNAEINASDILKITYGKKPLYEKSSVVVALTSPIE